MTRFGPFRVKQRYGIHRASEGAVAYARLFAEVALTAGVPVSGTVHAQAMVFFGGVAAIDVIVASAASLTAVTPHHPAGAADVVVVNSGSQYGTLVTGYMFVEPASDVGAASSASTSYYQVD